MNEGTDQSPCEWEESTVDCCRGQATGLFLRGNAEGRAWARVPVSVLVSTRPISCPLGAALGSSPLEAPRDQGAKGLVRGQVRPEHARAPPCLGLQDGEPVHQPLHAHVPVFLERLC